MKRKKVTRRQTAFEIATSLTDTVIPPPPEYPVRESVGVAELGRRSGIAPRMPVIDPELDYDDERIETSLRPPPFLKHLVCHVRDEPSCKVDLAERTFFVGFDARPIAADLVDDAVRRYATIERLDDGTIRLLDLGAPGGVWLNGTRVSTAIVQVGDEIKLASARFRLAEGPSDDL